MSTATTQHQYTQHYQQQQQQQQHHQHHQQYHLQQQQQQQQKMDPNNKASSTPTSTSSSMMNNTQCRPCLNRFLEFRNQAINRMTLEYQKIWTGQGVPAIDSLNHIVYQSLRLSDHDLAGTVNDKCLYCESPLEVLKKSALEVVRTQFNPFLRNMIPYNKETTPNNNTTTTTTNNSSNSPEQHAMLDRTYTTATRGETTDSHNGYRVPGFNNTVGEPRGRGDVTLHQYTNLHQPDITHGGYNNGSGVVTGGQTSTTGVVNTNSNNKVNNANNNIAAQQFFSEVAKKCVKQQKRSSSSKNKNTTTKDTATSPNNAPSMFPTNFNGMLKQSPPSNPPGLFKYMGRRVDGKVSVMLRVQPSSSDQQQSDNSLIEIDQRKKQISFLQPSSSQPRSDAAETDVGATLSLQQQPQPPCQPKYFGFDNIFSPEERYDRISSGSLLDVLHAVINGGDGALITYGGPNTGKTKTMVGQDDSGTTAGILPCAIAWLYSLIDDCKQRTGARISVRVSAVEVVGRNEELRDLLSEQVSGTDSIDSHSTSPGIYLREDPVGGINLKNVREPQAASKEKAGFYLDAALASRSSEKCNQGSTQNSHMIFTFHIYQYRVEKNVRKVPSNSTTQYSGGISRLHLIDLSYVNQNFEEKSSQAPSHAALGQIIYTMLNGNKKVTLFKDSKLTRLLRDSIGNQTCRTTVIAHVSAEEKSYRKTLHTLNITQKIHRKRRKRNKNYNSSDNNSSCDESGKKHRMPAMISTRALEDNHCSDYNTSSAGEDSCDTVIYMGGSGHISDRDLTDNERPPSPNTMKIMKLKLSSSEDENTDDSTASYKVTPSSSSHPTYKDSTEDLRMKLRALDDEYDEAKKTSLQKSCSPQLSLSKHQPRQPSQHQLQPQNHPQQQQKPVLPPKPLIASKPVTGERVVNVVAPLVVKDASPSPATQEQHKSVNEHDEEKLEASTTTSPTPKISSMSPAPVLDHLASLEDEPVPQISSPPTVEELKREISIIFEAQDHQQAVNNSAMDRNVSEKDLRNQEKRIEKLLTDINPQTNSSGDEVDGQHRDYNRLYNKSVTSSTADGYMSDVTVNHHRYNSHNHHQQQQNYHSFSPRHRSNSRDGYISAPEYSKPVQVVRGMVRKQASLDETTCGVVDSFKRSTILTKNSFDSDDKEETCVDDILRKIDSENTSMEKTKKEDPIKIQELTVGRFSSIREEQSNILISPSKQQQQLLELEEEGETRIPSVKHEQPTTSTNTSIGANLSRESSIDKDCQPASISSSGKLQNLDHIITVSSVPNFSVVKKPSLSNLPPSSPTMFLKGIESLDLMMDNGRTFSPPHHQFERSYSREDTISVVSSTYDSDVAYDSDNFSSPSASRFRKNPARLRYRWSTVYEEPSDDRKTGNSNNKQQRTKTVVDSEAKPSRMIASPKISIKGNCSSPSPTTSSLASRFIGAAKSPKHEHHTIKSHPSPVTTTPSTSTPTENVKSPRKYFPSLGGSSSSKKSSNDATFCDSPASTPKSSSTPLSPKTSKSKFSILSPRSERKKKQKNNTVPAVENTTEHHPTIPHEHSTDNKRMSGYSDTSSGIDSGIHSQTSSLRSGEEIKVDDSTIVREEIRSSKHKLWPFGRSKSRKSTRSLSGYASDSVTESRSRRSRFFSRNSKSSLHNASEGGYFSGYETSVTEGGMTSCNEDNYTTDNESVTGKNKTKKKKRFLSGFRRRSTSDLSSTRGRVKKPLHMMWKRGGGSGAGGSQSDVEDLQLKVYQIDGPQQPHNHLHKNMQAGQLPINTTATSRQMEGLLTQSEQLKKPVGYMKYQPTPLYDHHNQYHHHHQQHPQHYQQYPPQHLQQQQQHTPQQRLQLYKYQQQQQQQHQQRLQQLQRYERPPYGDHQQQQQQQRQLQVVTCFDGSSRKVTQI